MIPGLLGLHHVTALAGDAPRNLRFCRDVLGLHLVKLTVNFDEPSMHHLYYGDRTGRPGTILTFFPMPGGRRGRIGAGMITRVAFAVSPGSIEAWNATLGARGVDTSTPFRRLDRETVLRFPDPDGLVLELVAPDDVTAVDAGPARDTSADAGRTTLTNAPAIRRLHGVGLLSRDLDATLGFLVDVLGMTPVDGTDGRLRVRASDPDGGVVDVEGAPRGAERGRVAAGTTHHVAFRVPDDASLRHWRAVIAETGAVVTEVKDRKYFRSIYVREPGGVLVELATDPPGFDVDEPPDTLGTALRLPASLESRRAEIEAALPDLDTTTSR